MRPNRVKKLLREGKPAVGTWLSLASITAARFMARTGFDWLTVDVEHSLAGIETTAHILGSIADAGCTRARVHYLSTAFVTAASNIQWKVWLRWAIRHCPSRRSNLSR